MTNTTTKMALSTTVNKFMKNVKYGLLGGLTGLLVHYPLLLVLAGLAIQISNANDYNTNTDSFMAGILCWPLAVGISFVLGVVGGILGAKRASWLGNLLAVLGGLLGSLLLLIPLTYFVLEEWASY
jgi:hypothetical protein